MTIISKFEPNLPKFRSFWVNWELGGEFRRKKNRKFETGRKKPRKKRILAGGVILPNLTGCFTNAAIF